MTAPSTQSCRTVRESRRSGSHSVHPLCVALLVLACAMPVLCGPIHDAAEKGKVEKVVALLQANPELVSSLDNFGNTPLHLAARNNQLEVARILIANGADVNAMSHHSIQSVGMTPLHAALLSYHHKEMVELLISRGADVNAGDTSKATPLHYAVRNDLMLDAKLLLANGAEVNARDSHSASPLHWAVGSHHLDMVKLLVSSDADVNAISGCTPLRWAVAQERVSEREMLTDNTKMIEFLRSHGARECCFPGCTPDSK
jgi:ankyrin repeat protein